jgi:hypothetical protein
VALAGVATLLGVGLLASACGGSGGEHFAEEACGHVATYLTLIERSADTASSHPNESAKLQAQAVAQLRDALPYAARASFRNKRWEALNFTLAESGKVDPDTLAYALSRQCGIGTASSAGSSGVAAG